jgi:2'-5' RNA ligase
LEFWASWTSFTLTTVSIAYTIGPGPTIATGREPQSFEQSVPVAEPPPLESVVLVPVLDAGQRVRDFRMQYDPSAAAGIPPHVTLMFPFTSPADLSEPIIDRLEGLISRAKAFEFSLTRVGQFEQGVVYLEPEPAAPFARLTKEIGRQFGLLPFGGAFGDNPVTHLTVAMLDSPLNRQDLVTQLGTELPIRIRAEEAWLMVGTNSSSWKIVRQMRMSG